MIFVIQFELMIVAIIMIVGRKKKLQINQLKFCHAAEKRYMEFSNFLIRIDRRRTDEHIKISTFSTLSKNQQNFNKSKVIINQFLQTI